MGGAETVASMHTDLWLASAVNGLLLGGLYTAASLGLSMVFGVMRLVNVVHGELVLLGAYLSWTLFNHFGLDPFLSLIVVAPILFVVGYGMQRLLLNPLMAHGMEAPMLTTFGLSIIAQSLFLLIWTPDTRSIKTAYADNVVKLGGIHVPQMYVVASAAAVLLVGTLYLLVTRTLAGKAVRAAAQSAETAAVMGIRIPHIFALTYGLAAAVAAVGGVLVATTFTFVPSSGTSYLLKGFVVVVLGGMGSIGGTLLAGLLLGLSESLGAAAFGTGYKDLVGLAIFLFVLTLRPAGLFGRS
jgi:branched-chain amino acid transport system permease protein